MTNKAACKTEAAHAKLNFSNKNSWEQKKTKKTELNWGEKKGAGCLTLNFTSTKTTVMLAFKFDTESWQFNLAFSFLITEIVENFRTKKVLK